MDFWKDSVWSKVIAGIILPTLASGVRWILGERSATSFRFIRFITTPVPIWIYISGLCILLLCHRYFPDYLELACCTIGGACMFLAIIFYRKQQKQSVQAESSLQAPVNGLTAFDSKTAPTYSLRWTREKRWEGGAVGDIAQGECHFEEDKVINIVRTNKDGRLVIHIDRLHGTDLPRIDRNRAARANRVVQIEFDAHVNTGVHVMLFVAKKANEDGWVHNANRRFQVDARHWKHYSDHFDVPNTEDFILFFEDREVSQSPSSIQIKNLVIQVIDH